MLNKMKTWIQPELVPGEALLWSGKPRRGFTFHPASLLLIIMILFVLALIGGLILVNNTLHFVKIIEQLTSGESARVFFTYLVAGSGILLGMVALWGFVFYPLERRKTTYTLTDRRAMIVSGLWQRKTKSFDIKMMNFCALTQAVKDKATIIFGQVDPDQYGAADPLQKQAEINTWKRFGYRFELFEVGASNDTGRNSVKRPKPGRFEFIEDPRTVYAMLRERITIRPPEPASKIEQPKITSFVEGVVKRPGTLAFVIDLSSSMNGKKLDQAKRGLIGALNMSGNNLVGLISFNDKIIDMVPVASLAQNRQLLYEKVNRMSATGCTALYDSIKTGIEMTDSAASRADDVCTVVVLTDGQANTGETSLHDIIKMNTRDGRAIDRFSGFENDGASSEGAFIKTADIKGVGLVMPTKHPVQIFFIGIGSDADMEIGRILAEATGAESEKGLELLDGATVQRVRRIREVDIARVLEEFKYF
jgi:Mg-chelatase subunit ChlD